MAGLTRCCILLLALLPMLLLSACSTGTRLAYNNLDRLALWKIGDYVELDAAQKTAFRTEFAPLWRWHRQNELPRYASDMRALAAAFAVTPADSGTTEQAVLQAIDEFNADGERIWQQLLPGTERLLASLSDTQIAQWQRDRRKEIEDEEQERANETLDQRRKRFIERQTEMFDGWIGELNAPQKALLLRAWIDAQPSLPTAAERHTQRLAVLDRFARLMGSRKEPGLGARIEALEDEDPAAKARREADEARDNRLMLEVLLAADSKQRRKLSQRLSELAEDCEALSRQAAPAASAAQPAS